MVQVPIVQGPKVDLAPLPGLKESPETSLESFGAGQSSAAVTGQAQDLTSKVQRYAMDEQDRMDAAAVLKAQADATSMKIDRMQNPNDGFLTQHGENAAKAMPEYADAFDKGLTQIENGLGNAAQKEMFARIRQGQSLDFENDLKTHVANQAAKFKVDSADYAIRTAREDAAAHPEDPARITQNIKDQLRAYDTIADGVPKSEYDATRKQIISQTHGSVVESMLNGGDDGVKAKKYLDANAGEMTEVDRNKAHDQVQTALIPHWGMQVWNKVQGMRLADGKPDERRQTAYIEKLPDFDQQTKDKIEAFVKARSGQDIADQARESESRLFSYKSNLDKLYVSDLDPTSQHGSPALLANAFRMADRLAKPGDVEERDFYRALATKKFGPDYDSNLDTKLQIFTGIQSGTTTSKDIQLALDRNQLSQTDAYTAWMDLNKSVGKKMAPDMKGAYKIVDDMARLQFSSKNQKPEYQQFMNTMLDSPAYKSRDAEAFLKLGTEGLKGRPSNWGLSGWLTLGIAPKERGLAPTWKANPGHVTGAIGELGSSGPGQSQSEGGGFTDQQLAAAEASLLRHGKAVTREARAAVLAQHPDGVWP